jgi:iron complex outermembrane recepter protein
MSQQKSGVQRWVPLLFVCTLAAGGCSALSNGVSSTPVALKELSLHELMNIEVTSVSRTPTRRFETAAAIQVITHDDIHRSGATTLAEALRLVPNLQIAQSNSHDWAIAARGFNGANVSTGSIANKLLVMIDGRSIYTPLFGGVFWDAQHVNLDDIDRIEVVSGPGGSLWGANAVNGVINIITKSAEETQGGNATVAVGSFLEKFGAARYGGRIGNDFSYRVYGQRFDADSVQRSNGTDGNDDWNLTQAGVRTDSRISEADSLTVQGDFYEGGEGTPATAFINGQNAIARWTHTTSPESEWIAQVYFDRTKRTFPTASFREELQTVDIDVQHRFPVGTLHTILWGAGYRQMWDDVKNGPGFSFLPGKRTMQLASAFVQDEVTVRNARVTFGTKFEHNEFSGLEAQPSVRVAWTPTERQMAWTAVSRAIRSPARFDTEIKSGATFGNPDFAAEKVMAYELGYRISPSESLALSLSVFHNRYTDLRSVNLGAQPGTLVFDNDMNATTFGVELSGAFQPTEWWRLRGGYTHLEKNLRLESPLSLTFSDPFEAQDPQNQMLLQSMIDLPRGMQFDVVARHVAELPVSLVGPRIPAYTTADVRLAWRVSRWELAAIGKNLGGSHPEFNSPVLWYEIPRSVQGRLSFAW